MRGLAWFQNADDAPFPAGTPAEPLLPRRGAPRPLSEDDPWADDAPTWQEASK